MFRRRTSSAPTLSPPAAPADAGGITAGQALAAQLAEAGWVLPRGLATAAPASWTLIGTVGSTTATSVDPRGLVVGDGWSLDWWIGADDRWHLPAREAAVRQGLVDDAPIVETLVRVPGGEVAHRAYGIRSPRSVGDEWVMAEIENRTAIPLAVALVLRPFTADAVGSISSITIEPTTGRTGRDVAHLVRVDGRPVLVLPRRPARLATGNRAAGDVLATVTAGEAGEDLVEATCADGLATLALVFPLTHTARIQMALPVGDVSDSADEPLAWPAVIPDAATVASGWEVHRRGPRFEVPDQRLATMLRRARTRIQLAHDGESVHRDGRPGPDLEAGATEVLLGAFDVLDRPGEVGAVVSRWVDRLAVAEPAEDALFLDVVSRHWLVHRMDALLTWLLPEVAASVERLDRADRRGRLTDPVARTRAVVALDRTSRMLARAGQPDAGRAVAALVTRFGDATRPTPDLVGGLAAAVAAGSAAEVLVDLGHEVRRGRPTVATDLDAVVRAASATGAWPGPGRRHRLIGDDLAAAAALVLAVRNTLIDDEGPGLALLPVHPDGWYGGGVEVHDAPTAFGMVSYAVRWHGTRPALLWELDPHEGDAAVTITIPGLDPTWSTTEWRGDALLAEVAPPQDLEAIQVVSEHPDIDPVMRRPGTAPTEPMPTDLPEGGTFS